MESPSFFKSIASHFWPETPYLLLAVLAAVILLSRLRPQKERGSYRNTFALFVMGLALQALSAIAPMIVEAVSGSRVSSVLNSIGVIVLGIAAIRLTGFVIFRLILPAFKFTSPLILEDLAIIFGYSIFALAQLRHVGIDITTIFATSAVVTAVLAFAMQDTLGNILGGLAIQLDDSIEIGDIIKVDDVIGRVTEIQWRSTQIQTANWETLVIPNSRLMKGQFTVLGKRQGEPVQWRRWVKFSVDPKVAPAKVIELATQAMMETDVPFVSKSPVPNCIVLGFDEGNVQYAARYFLTNIPEDFGTDSAIRVCIFNKLQRHGVRIAEPQRTSNVVSRDEDHMHFVSSRETQRKAAMLDSVDIFQTLSIDERMNLAASAQYAPFAKGDWLTKQGKTAHWLYIIATGEAEVIKQNADSTQTHLAKLGPGQFFGEMGLMTGEPRSASVRALSNMECYRLDKAAFEAILHERPELAEEVSHIIATRRQLSDAAISDAKNVVPINPHHELLKKMRVFFGIKAE